MIGADVALCQVEALRLDYQDRNGPLSGLLTSHIFGK